MTTYINPEAIKNKSITKDKLSDDLFFDIKGEIPKNEIWYTSNDDSIVIPLNATTNFYVFGANIVSNTYESGKGIIKFDGDVTFIGNYAFDSCSSLTSVIIPNSVTSIGESAFSHCWSLIDVNIPDSVTSIGLGAFLDTALTSVIIPNSVTSIEGIAFADCPLLTSINIKNHVPISIGSDAFNGVSSNFKIYIPVGTLQSYISATNWSNYAEHIYECVFEDENLISGQNIKTINGESILGDGDIAISATSSTGQPNNEIWYTTNNGERCALWCNHPNFVSHTKEDDKYVIRFSKPIVELYGLKLYETIDSPEDDEESVYGCVDTIYFPNSLKKITERVLMYEYTSIDKVVLSNNISSLVDDWAGSPSDEPQGRIGVLEIGGTKISNNLTSSNNTWLNRVDRVIIKEGTQKIGNYVFAESGIEMVTIPDSVTEIGLAAFYKATNLEHVQLGDSVKIIGNSAFNYTAITALELPATVTSLGSTFVRNCTNLKKLTVNSVAVPTISANSLPNPNQYKYSIIVPDESLIAYKKATNWSLYSLYIHSINEEITLITYEDLKALKDAHKLVPGHQYRIIDYYATSAQPETNSSYNYFDIIVTALTPNTFSEEAKATHSSNDLTNHFSKANLSAWQLWYCFDNDVNRFAWADSVSGRGVIYRMIDEFGNDCPYDFKNIQFDKYLLCVTKFIRKSDNKVFKYFGTTFNKAVGNGAKRIYCYLEESVVNNFSGPEVITPEGRLCFNDPLEPYYQDLYTVQIDDIQAIAEYECNWDTINSDDYYNIDDIRNYTKDIRFYEGSIISAYTFNLRTSGQVSGSYDYSIHNNDGKCFRNVIKCKYDETNAGKMYIPYVIFDNTTYGACYKNEIEAPIISKDGESCRLIFGNHNHNNSLGRGCFNIFTGNGCFDNRFDTATNNIVMLTKCTTNTFGTHTSNITMLDECTGNTFDAYCDNKAFNIKTVLHKGCDFNKFGSYCYGLTLNESCSYNVFEGNNINIVLEKDSDYNWFAPYWRGRSVSGDYKHYTNTNIEEYEYAQLLKLKTDKKLNPGQKYKLLDYVSDSSLCPILTAITTNSFDRKATAVDKNGNSYDIEFNIDKISGNLNTDKDNTGIILTLDRSPYANHDENVFIKSNGEGSEYDKKGLVITPIIPDEMSSIKSGEYYKFNVDQMYVYDANGVDESLNLFDFDNQSFSYPHITDAKNQLCMYIYKDNVNENLIVELYSDDKLIKEYSTTDIYEFGQYVSFDNFLDIDGLVLRTMINASTPDGTEEILYDFEYAIEYNNTIIIQDSYEQNFEAEDWGTDYHDFYIPNSMMVPGVDDGDHSGGSYYPVYICSKTPLIASNLKTYNQEFVICTKNIYMNANNVEISYYVPIYKGINPYYDESTEITHITEFNKDPEVGVSNTISKITLVSDGSLNGTITRMKDKNGNDAPIDFKNITIDGLSVFSDLQHSYSNQVECILEDDNVENYPYIIFTGGVKNNKISTGTSNIRIGSSYNFVGTGVSNQNIYEDGMTILNRLTYIE